MVRKAARKIPKTVDAVVFDRYIHKVLQQVHPDTGMSRSSMDTMNNIVRFALRKIITCIMRTKVKETVTAREVQLAVMMVLPGELAKHAVSEGTKAVTTFKSSGNSGKARRRESYARIQFSVSRVENVMRSMGLNRIGASAPVYLAAAVEYLAAEILELAGNAARDHKRKRIARKYVMSAIATDDELKCLLDSAILGGGVIPHIHSAILPKKK